MEVKTQEQTLLWHDGKTNIALVQRWIDERQERGGGCQLGIALPRLCTPARSARLQASPSTFLGRFSL